MATGRREVGRAKLSYSLLFRRDLRASAVLREGTLYDTAVLPALDPSERSEGRALLIVRRGTIELDGEAHVGPCALALSIAALEGNGARVRSWGEPFEALELAGREPRFVASKHGFLDLGSEVGSAAESLHGALRREARAEIEVRFEHLANSLTRRGVLRSTDGPLVGPAMPTAFRRAVEVVVGRLNLLPTLDELSQQGSISTRQLIRLTGAFLHGSAVPGRSWRAATLRLRLKAALLFLSADDATVGDVARAAGYGSPEAMTRAFRAAGLGPPSMLQAQLRDERHRASSS